MWDFAIKHPVLFTFGVLSVASSLTTVAIKALDKADKDENDECPDVNYEEVK
jgi:hypothetical protein